MPSKPSKKPLVLQASSSIRFSSPEPLSDEGLTIEQRMLRDLAGAALIQFVHITPRIKGRLNIEVRR